MNCFFTDCSFPHSVHFVSADLGDLDIIESTVDTVLDLVSEAWEGGGCYAQWLKRTLRKSGERY